MGIGDAGIDMLNHCIDRGVQAFKTIAVNQESESLRSSRADSRIALQVEGDDPEDVVRSVDAVERQLMHGMLGANLFIPIVGNGGMTGTFASGMIGLIAARLRIYTWSIVTEPFLFETSWRHSQKCNYESSLSYLSNMICTHENQMLLAPPFFEVGHNLFQAINKRVGKIVEVITTAGTKHEASMELLSVFENSVCISGVSSRRYIHPYSDKAEVLECKYCGSREPDFTYFMILKTGACFCAPCADKYWNESCSEKVISLKQ